MKKILNEAYGNEMSEDPRMRQQMGMQQNMQQPQGEMNDEEMMGEEEQGSPMEGGGGEVIDQIRQLAIQGIAQYADDIESEQYQSLKKIWLLTDKFYEDLQGDDEKRR